MSLSDSFHPWPLTIDRRDPSRPVHVELNQQRGLGAVVLRLVPPVGADEPHVPAVAQQRCNGVAAGSQQGGHVPGLVGDPLLILGPARHQLVLPDTPAVDVEPVHALRGRMYPRRRRRAGQLEAVHEAAHRPQLVHRVADVGVLRRRGHLAVHRVAADPRGPPFLGVHHAGAEPGPRPCPCARLVLDLDIPFVRRRRHQRPAAVAGADSALRLHHTGVPHQHRAAGRRQLPHPDAVGALLRATPVRFQPPGEGGRGDDAQRLVLPAGAQLVGSHPGHPFSPPAKPLMIRRCSRK